MNSFKIQTSLYSISTVECKISPKFLTKEKQESPLGILTGHSDPPYP